MRGIAGCEALFVSLVGGTEEGRLPMSLWARVVPSPFLASLTHLLCGHEAITRPTTPRASSKASPCFRLRQYVLFGGLSRHAELQCDNPQKDRKASAMLNARVRRSITRNGFGLAFLGELLLAFSVGS